MKHTRSFLTFAASLLLGGSAVLAILGLFGWGEHLLTIDNLPAYRDVDAVVVLASKNHEDRERILAGIQIFHAHHARYFILPLREPGIDWPAIAQAYRIDASLIPASNVIIGRMTPSDRLILDYCGGTYLEARKTGDLISANKLRSLAVVSSGYHLRRTRLAFIRTGLYRDFEVFFSPAAQGSYLVTQKGTETDRIRKILVEGGKLAGACFIYP